MPQKGPLGPSYQQSRGQEAPFDCLAPGLEGPSWIILGRRGTGSPRCCCGSEHYLSTLVSQRVNWGEGVKGVGKETKKKGLPLLFLLETSTIVFSVKYHRKVEAV